MTARETFVRAILCILIGSGFITLCFGIWDVAAAIVRWWLS